MAKITKIEFQKNKKRVNVYLDEKFAFGLSAGTLVKAELKVGQEITDDQIKKLIKNDEFLTVYENILRFISYRPRSKKEILNWFKKKRIGEESQKLVYQELMEKGYVNDEEFARWWIDQRTAFRPAGARLLSFELRQKGVDKDVIERVLSLTSSGSEHQLAIKTAEKKMKIYQRLPPLEFRRKLFAFLARRGFSFNVARKVVDELLKMR